MTYEILDDIGKDARILLYPSSCDYSPNFQSLPFDIVILNSHDFSRSRYRGKVGKVLCLDYDNNELLGLMAARGIKVSALVVIRDGCCEGGNYECIARTSFFGRLMPLLAGELIYFTDHKKLPDVPAQFQEFNVPDYLETIINLSDPFDNTVKAYHATLCPLVECQFQLGRVLVSIVHDSLWQAGGEQDHLIVKVNGESSLQATNHYLRGCYANRKQHNNLEILKKGRVTTIQNLLEKAAERKLSRIVLMPTAKGRYTKIVQEIKSWAEPFPKEVVFTHLNAKDYSYLKSLMPTSTRLP